MTLREVPMMTRVRPLRLLQGPAVLLGHASVLWGVGVALIYLAVLAVLVSQAPTGTRLPLSWPAVGLGTAVASVLLGLASREGTPRSGWVGVFLNALAMA